MKRGGITVDAFLKRVTWDGSDICDNMLDFENMSALEDENEDDFEFNDELITEPVEEGSSNLCLICYTRENDCALIPCGHIYFCMICYEAYKSTNRGTFSVLQYMENDDFD